LPAPGNYVQVKRKWRSGDVVALALPKTLRIEPLPDNPNRVALMWGPLVLAGDLGEALRQAPRAEGTSAPAPVPVPVFVTNSRVVSQWVKPVADKPGNFRTDSVGRDKDVDLVPFYRLHHRTYAAYWDLFTPAEWDKRQAAVRLAQQKQRKVD
ncbi:MAG: DUF4986 domain-containing protein, partial [Bacteroidales bacterium]